MSAFTTEEYTTGIGDVYAAVFVTWTQAARLIGRAHDGTPQDDRELTSRLLAAGAPDWLESPDCQDGRADQDGLWLIGPRIPQD